MKKVSGVIAILLLAVLAFGVLCGCGMFGKDTAKYRQLEAFTVGNQKVTVGKVIDTFNNLYNQYYQYASADDILSASLSSLYTQYMKVDAYIGGKTAETRDSAVYGGVDYAGYVTAQQAEYAIKYVKYLIFTNFDSAVETELKKDFELNDAETEDTSRDFKKFDDLKGAATYTDYLIGQLSVNDDMDEYIDKYYGSKFTVTRSLDEYKDSAATAAKLAEYNKRVKQEEDVADDKKVTITASQLEKAQNSVVKKYTDSIERAYETTMDEFFAQQANDVIVNLITSLYDAEQGRKIDGSDEAFSAISAKLTAAYNNETEAKKTAYNYKADDFVSAIEGLTDSTDILAVPDGYKYIYVKNVLIPFSAEQTAKLANLEKKLGTTDSDEYKKAREQIAAEIVADDYNSTKNDDGEYEKVEGLFAYDEASGKVALSSKGKEIFGTGAVSNDKIVELMARFNTDTASHSSYYDYVVRLDAPEDYTAKWVSEFVTAAEEAYGEDTHTVGNYAICVSTYGVHIVYYTGDVVAQQMEFTKDKCLDTTSREYLRFKTEYNTERSQLVTEAAKELQKTYFIVKDADGKVTNETKIKFSTVFDSFLKDQGLTYDKTAGVTYESDEN